MTNIRPTSLNGVLEFSSFLSQQELAQIVITDSSSPATYSRVQAVAMGDYLVWPFDKVSLQAAIEQMLLEAGHPDYVNRAMGACRRERLINQHIFVRRRSGLVKLNISSIDFIEADGNYCMISLSLR